MDSLDEGKKEVGNSLLGDEIKRNLKVEKPLVEIQCRNDSPTCWV